MSTANNSNLIKAKRAKNDEFYTLYEDIEAEVIKYKEMFYNKIVYLPCDNADSNFFIFFINHFTSFNLKKVVATYYDPHKVAYKIWADNPHDIYKEVLAGNGDFRSPECVDILKECDIVCTNPPFSLFRDFVDILLTHNKQFLIIGNQNAFTYKEIFHDIQSNSIWTGYNMVKKFVQPDGSIKTFGNVCWFTNLNTTKRFENIKLTKKYADNPEAYPKYDSCDAIEVNRVANIPMDYDGAMGVPITFLDKYNPNQFTILGLDDYPAWRGKGPVLNGKTIYRRVIIQRNN